MPYEEPKESIGRLYKIETGMPGRCRLQEAAAGKRGGPLVEAMKRLISGVLGAVRVDQRAPRARGWVGGRSQGGQGL